jgi:hypothetical protein
MKDNNPLKSLYTLRDIITGLIHPWHVGKNQQDAADNLKIQLNLIIEKCILDDTCEIEKIKEIYDSAIDMITLWIGESCDLKTLHDRLERVQMMIRSLQKYTLDVM